MMLIELYISLLYMATKKCRFNQKKNDKILLNMSKSRVAPSDIDMGRQIIYLYIWMKLRIRLFIPQTYSGISIVYSKSAIPNIRKETEKWENS